MIVRILGLDNEGNPKEYGKLLLKEGRIICEPDSSILKGILSEDSYSFEEGKIIKVSPDNPEEFLKSLHFKYKSAYFCATLPE